MSEHVMWKTEIKEKYGLTKREYFAAMAMQGLLTNPEISPPDAKFLAEKCIEVADALIAQLAKSEEEK